jgi:GcrA cell cycle regulator
MTEIGMSWTDERVETLRKLWQDGMSASQIAAELGHGISRNAVIGKVHRLGLSGRVKAPSSAAPRARNRDRDREARFAPPRPPQPMVQGANALAYSPKPHPAPAPRQAEEVVVPISERVTILELREAMCRWPLGDPSNSEFRYCGAKSPQGVSYCAYHSRIAYQPAQDRRRDRDRRMMRSGG